MCPESGPPGWFYGGGALLCRIRPAPFAGAACGPVPLSPPAVGAGLLASGLQEDSVVESTSAVDLEVQARISAVHARVEAGKRRRAELAAARKAGLRHRREQRLRNLADAEQRRLAAEHDDGQADDVADTDGGRVC